VNDPAAKEALAPRQHNSGAQPSATAEKFEGPFPLALLPAFVDVLIGNQPWVPCLLNLSPFFCARHQIAGLIKKLL